MKLILSALMVMGMTSFAHAIPEINDSRLRAHPGCSAHGDCNASDDDDDDAQSEASRRKYMRCLAKDGYGNRYYFTASYGYKTSQIVAGAIQKCQRNSPAPATCRSGRSCKFVW